MKRTQKLPKPRKGAWFVPVRGSYLPVSWQGWVTYIPFIAFLVLAQLYGRHEADSVAEAILLIVPNYVAAAAVTTWIAKHKS